MIDPDEGILSEESLREFMALPLQEQFYQPNVIITTRKVKERYAAMLVCQKRYRDMLEDEKSWLMRYLLKRRLGYKRLDLLWPWAGRMRSRIRWRWIDWKHRKDPEW